MEECKANDVYYGIITKGPRLLLARSSSVPRGVNVVIIPGICGADRLSVVEGDKLDKLGVRKRV